MQVREARPEDYEKFTEFWAELETVQPVPERERWLELMAPSTIFLASGDELAAYALVFPLGSRGDVRQIVVAPSWRRRGIGRELMAAVAARLRAAGCREWRLEVRDQNTPAIALYRRVGMDVIHHIEILRIRGDAAAELAATRSGRLTVVAVDPAHDAELEARFDLGVGQLARWRKARPSAMMFQVPGAALAHYARDFAPELGLLFPFRAPDADHAAHLLAEACALGTRDALEIFVIDAAVGAALRAAGARASERMLEMGGPLL